MIVGVLDIGDHAREGKRLEIPAAHLNDRAKTAIESTTTGCLDHIDLSSEHGVSSEDASTAFWRPDFALLKVADGPITVMLEIIAVPVGQAGDHFAPRMIIGRQEDVTPAVPEAMSKKNARLREVMASLVAHLYVFVGEVRLTEEEWEYGIDFLNRIGKATHDAHNEGVLFSDAIGFSTLVCLLNNGKNGATETASALLGPFRRMNSPHTENGGSIVRPAHLHFLGFKRGPDYSGVRRRRLLPRQRCRVRRHPHPHR